MQHMLFVVGARPNLMKSAPVLQAVAAAAPEIKRTLVHTGQHYDPAMSEILFRELSLPEPDVHLAIGSGSHAVQTARALEGVAAVLEERRPDLVVVAGDVNSTLAAALAAVKLGIPVAHIEAGLRSRDWQMPEEHNRRLTDHVSSILLVHSDDGAENLVEEGVDPSRIHLVGNTMIDSVLAHLARARAHKAWERHGFEAREYGLITLHRPALVDDPDMLRRTMLVLRDLSETVPLLFPMHPRTRDRIASAGLGDASGRLVLTEPMSYLDFLGAEAEAAFVLTDSGGVQEETTALGVRCFTLRENTERPVTVTLGSNILLGLEPERIRDIPAALGQSLNLRSVPLWDGEAGQRAASVLIASLRPPAAWAAQGSSLRSRG